MRAGGCIDSIPWHRAGIIGPNCRDPSRSSAPFARFGNVIPLALGFLLLFAAIALGRRRRYSTDI